MSLWVSATERKTAAGRLFYVNIFYIFYVSIITALLVSPLVWIETPQSVQATTKTTPRPLDQNQAPVPQQQHSDSLHVVQHHHLVGSEPGEGGV